MLDLNSDNQKMIKKQSFVCLAPGVNFINILQTAFSPIDYVDRIGTRRRAYSKKFGIASS